jgi:hypothetical protein
MVMPDRTDPTEARMKVRYSPALGIIFLVLGFISFFLGAWLSLLGDFTPAVLVGPLVMVFGVLYLVRPYFLVYSTSVQVPGLYGPFKREFRFQTLEVDGGRLYAIREDGSRKKVPVARWLARSSDWTAAVPH